MRLNIRSINEPNLTRGGVQDDSPHAPAPAGRIVEHVLDYTRSSGEVTCKTHSAYPLQLQDQQRSSSCTDLLNKEIDKRPRELESGNIIRRSRFSAIQERSMSGSVSFTSLHSEQQQVRSPRLRASFRVTNSGPLGCLKDCSCRCHHRSIIRSPRYLSNYLGDIFLGASNLPFCFSALIRCNEQTCRRSRSSSTELKYFFPSWVSRVMMSFSVSFTLQMLPLNVCLQSRRTIPYDSPILVCVQEGNIDGVRSLLRSGEASLNDVDPYGLGLLYVSRMN